MPKRKLTVNDVKHRAEEVQALAKAEVKKVTHSDPAKLIAVGLVGVLVVASFAFYLGTRKCTCGDAFE